MKRWLKRCFISITLGWVLFTGLIVAAGVLLDPPIWAWKLSRWISPPPEFPDQIKHNWVALDNIARPMQLAVIASEDQLFNQHNGFDIASIKDAAKDILAGERFRGASTISQQTAKNLYLWPGQNLLRKGLEAWFTLLMEQMWAKPRILEIYLNIVEFGPGIYGVEAASQHFFGKAAAKLNSRESALLAAVLPNPYQLDAGKPSVYLNKRIRWIQQQMRQLGVQTIP